MMQCSELVSFALSSQCLMIVVRVTLSHGATGLSAVYDCGVSRVHTHYFQSRTPHWPI